MVIAESLRQMDVKGSPERQQLAAQLHTVRIHERARGYVTDRGPRSYEGYLLGYYSFLEYVRQLDGPNLILDIGAGTTRSINHISKSPQGRGLRFEATALRFRGEIDEYLGRRNTHITSAELMRGIEPQSVGGAIAVYSVTYSAFPERTVDMIDSILVPGGIFKGKFASGRNKTSPNGRLSIGPVPFERRFKELGYDVIVDQLDLMLAKKPGGNLSVTATDLYMADLGIEEVLWPRIIAIRSRIATRRASSNVTSTPNAPL